MVQIPQYTQQEGLAAPSRDIPNVIAPSDGGIGNALQSLGGAITNVAEAVQARQNAKDTFNTKVRFDAYQEQVGQAAVEAERNAPADGTGIHDTLLSTRSKLAGEFLGTITNPQLREHYKAVLDTSDAEHWSNIGANTEWKASNKYSTDQLGNTWTKSSQGIVASPGEVKAYVDDMIAQVDKAPDLTASQREEMKQKIRENGPKIAADALQNTDPEALYYASGRGTHDQRIGFLTRRVIAAESGFDPNAESGKGASGVMQVMPDLAGVDVAKQLGDKAYLAMSTEERKAFLKVPANGLRYGQVYLGMMIQKYDGDVEAALVAYNAGPDNADKWLAHGRDYNALPKPAETGPYVQKVMGGLGGARLAAGAADPGTASKVPVFTIGKPAGLVTPGNIDLTTRPHVQNGKDTSTVRTISYGTDQGEVLIPTVSDEGKIMSDKEAMAYWQKKGQNLGVFKTPGEATAYAKDLHEQQATTLTAADKAPRGTKALGIVTGSQAGRQPLQMDGVKPELLKNFQLLQGDFGKQIPIVSGYRDKATNTKAGGANHSQHIEGNAIDLDVSGLSKQERIQLIQKASARGFTGIGIYKNSIHLDMRAGAPVAWGSDHHAASVPAWAFHVAAQHRQGAYGQGIQVADASGTGGLSMNDAGPQYADGVPGGEPRSGFVSPVFHDLPAGDLLNIQNNSTAAFTKGQAAQLAQATADQVLAAAGANDSGPGDRAAAYKALDSIKDAELKKDVAPLVDSHFTRWDAVQKDKAQQDLATTRAAVQDLLTKGDTAGAFNALKRSNIQPGTEQYNSLQTLISKGPVPFDDPHAQMEAQALKADPQTFASTDLATRFGNSLTTDTITKLMADQQGVRKTLAGQGDDVAKQQLETVTKANSIINDNLQAIGIPTTGTKVTPADMQHANLIRAMVTKELENKQAASKNPLLLSDITDTVESVMKTYPRFKPIESSWLPWKAADADVSMPEVLDAFDSAKMDPQLAADALRKAGKPVNAATLQQTLDDYLAVKNGQ